MLGPVELVAEVDSTNSALLDRARRGEPAGLVLVADHQTAGRGRLDRRWEAAPGTSLLVSVLLRPQLEADALHRTTMAAAVAGTDTCRSFGAAAVAVKWPNDLVADGRKLAGILAESLISGGSVDAVVVGMGLNLDWRGAPPEGAVDLATLVGRSVDRQELLDDWLGRLDSWLDAGADRLLASYRARCGTLGSAVRVECPDGPVEGRAVDVDELGRLLVDDAHGGRRAVAVGDVLRSRPA